MKFNSNKERKAYWEMIESMYPVEELNRAMDTLKEDTKKVLCLHYRQKYSLVQITKLINRSITVVRNHHNRGIYKIYRYFNPRTSGNT